MSYTINISDKFEYMENLTINNLSEEFLLNSEEFQSFKENEENSEFQTIEEFRDSEFYDDLLNRYYPIYNYYHILQNEPNNAQLELLAELTSIISILNYEEFELNLIGLNSCGQDNSEFLELAYYIIDGIAPVHATDLCFSSKRIQSEITK